MSCSLMLFNVVHQIVLHSHLMQQKTALGVFDFQSNDCAGDKTLYFTRIALHVLTASIPSWVQSENIMLAEKFKIEKDQNAQLRNQVALLLQLEQDHKLQIQQRDSTVQTLQVGHVLTLFYLQTAAVRILDLNARSRNFPYIFLFFIFKLFVLGGFFPVHLCFPSPFMSNNSDRL